MQKEKEIKYEMSYDDIRYEQGFKDILAGIYDK